MLQVRPPLVEWRAEPRTFDYDSLATWKIDRRWLNLLDAREIICANEGSGNALFRAVSEAHRGSPTTTSSPTLTGELQLRCAVAPGEVPDGWHVVESSRQTSYSGLRDKFTRLRWVGKLQLCKISVRHRGTAEEGSGRYGRASPVQPARSLSHTRCAQSPRLLTTC
jgi:hypothetical protein